MLHKKSQVNSCEKGHHKLLHAMPPRAGQTSEQKDVHCGKAQVNASSSSKVTLKTVVVAFVSDAREIVIANGLLDPGSETILIRTGFAMQLGVKGQKKNLTGNLFPQRKNSRLLVYVGSTGAARQLQTQVS